MAIKDYYSILQLPPAATLPEIKKAYRKLALLYHPDKNDNDEYATAQFNEIKEAYETLSHPSRKDAYLQQRWYEKSINRRFANHEPITPPLVLKQSLELNRYVSTLDVFRLDQGGLSSYIQKLIADEIIKQLHTFNEPEINHRIISTLLSTCYPLHIKYLIPVTEKLKKLAIHNQQAIDEIDQFIRKTEQRNAWHQYKIIAAVILTLLLCLLIYKVA